MEIGSKKGIVVGVTLLAVMALFAFWAFYFRNTDFYVSLFKSEASNSGALGGDIDLKINGSDGPVNVAAGQNFSVNWDCNLNSTGAYEDSFRHGERQNDWKPNNSLSSVRGSEQKSESSCGKRAYTLFCWDGDPNADGYLDGEDSVTVDVCGGQTQTPTPTPAPTSTQNQTQTAQRPSCQIPQISGRTIFNFPEGWLGDNGTPIMGPYNFSLPSGNYKVTLMSYDDHPNAQDQPNERYFARLSDATGTIADSSPIDDLPKNSTTLVQQVNASFSVSRSGTKIQPLHVGPPSSLTNSITPICAAFDVIASSAVITCNDALPIDRSDAARLLVQKLPLTIQTTGGPHFADVPVSDPDYSYIETLYNKGITAGCSTNPLSYCPTAPATRGQLVILVVKAKGWALLDPAVPSFSDVPKGSVYYKYIETAKARGLIAGYPDGTFKPDETILANQACALAGFTPTSTPTPTNTPTSTPTATPSGAPGISIIKSVNISNLPSSGGFVAYTYSVSNTGNVALSNLSVTDNKCTSVTFVQGDNNGNAMLETSEVWKYQCNTFLSVTTTNTATAGGVYNGQTVTASDQETVYVQGTTPAPTPYPVLNISIEKLGQNLTKQETQLNNRVNASPGDLVQFTLRVTSDSNTRLTNVMVRDDLPAEMTYDPGSTYINGYSVPDGIIGNGISVGSLDPNQVVTITFRARIKPSDSFQTGTTVLINGGYARADGVAIRESKIPIYVVKNILVPVGTVETGVDGATAVILASLVLTFGYHFARSGATFIKSGFGSILHADSIVPSTKMLAVAATLLILFAGTLTVSTLLDNSQITQIEIRNPIVRTDHGTYFGQIGR